jgi:cardiolipin synthase
MPAPPAKPPAPAAPRHPHRRPARTAAIVGWSFALLLLAALRRRGYEPLQVSLVGKAATLCLLYAFPLLFLGAHAGPWALAARVAGWAFAIWGTALYWWAAALYLRQTASLITASPGGGAGGPEAGRAHASPR